MTDRLEMLAGMAPEVSGGPFAFRTITNKDEIEAVLSSAIGMFRESEGVSLILPAKPDDPLAMTRITLKVWSSLEGVGLTAGVAVALADAGIPCNLVAAFHHDHVFVPVALADAAVEILQDLAADAGRLKQKT